MFWDIENIPGRNIALIDDKSGEIYTYGRLAAECAEISKYIKPNKKKLIFLFCDNSAPAVAGYLFSLRQGHAVYLANSKMDPELKQRLIQIYKPDVVMSTEVFDTIPGSYEPVQAMPGLFVYSGPAGGEINKELAVLLSTSGTTGSPKLVRLSYGNIQANAGSIAEYLSLDESERPVTSLPVSYSYGLSVVNSHILKGASVFCTDKSMVMREFWDTFKNNKCTSFSGVPYNYQMLRRLKFDSMEIPGLRTMTQAGGRLSGDLIKYFYDLAKAKNIRFFVMYGQTEATARISYVPWERLGEKIGSTGLSVPGGKIMIYADGKETNAAGTEGELVYSGPNVMMGYADSREDLEKDDECGGLLKTGDLAYKDEDGFAYITGRLKRFIKLFGMRVNLDDVERMIEKQFGVPAACYGNDDTMKILLQSKETESAEKVKQKIIDVYKIHHSVVKVKNIILIPVNDSGKRDYNAIREMGP